MARKRGVRVAAGSASGAGPRLVVALSLAVGFAIAGLLPGLAVAGALDETNVVAVMAPRREPAPAVIGVTHRQIGAAERSLLQRRLPAIAVPRANRYGAPSASILVREAPGRATASP